MNRGRPKSNNPKNCPIKIMLDQATFDKIAREASDKGISIAEVFRRSYEATSNRDN